MWVRSRTLSCCRRPILARSTVRILLCSIMSTYLGAKESSRRCWRLSMCLMNDKKYGIRVIVGSMIPAFTSVSSPSRTPQHSYSSNSTCWTTSRTHNKLCNILTSTCSAGFVVGRRFACTCLSYTDLTLPYLTLPYLRGGQVITPAQRWGRISSAQCATPM